MSLHEPDVSWADGGDALSADDAANTVRIIQTAKGRAEAVGANPSAVGSIEQALPYLTGGEKTSLGLS